MTTAPNLLLKRHKAVIAEAAGVLVATAAALNTPAAEAAVAEATVAEAAVAEAAAAAEAATLTEDRKAGG